MELLVGSRMLCAIQTVIQVNADTVAVNHQEGLLQRMRLHAVMPDTGAAMK